MSKISEQKALVKYPRQCDYIERRVYKESYDQAMKDFLEKAEKWFEDNFSIIQGIPEYFVVKEFKNYMQNE